MRLPLDDRECHLSLWKLGGGDFERMIGLDSSTLVILKRLVYAPENLGGTENFLKVALRQIVKHSIVKVKYVQQRAENDL